MVFTPKNISQGDQRPKRMQPEPDALAALRDSRRDPTQRVVEAIMRVGPRNAALLSRLTGVPTETVRYKIKKQLKEMGFRIHADVDYERLGLRRHWATFGFPPEYSELAPQILNALSEIGYLIYYARIIPQGHYVVLFALPEGSTEKYREFLRHLVDLRVLRTFSLEELAWMRHLSMNPKYFDFSSGKWELDWTRVELEKVILEQAQKTYERAEIDKDDLLLIKELQKDCTQSVIDIARKVKIHPKTLRYHYHAHLEHRRLIAGHIVRWMKDVESTRAHTILNARVSFTGLTQAEILSARSIALRIPFVWAEDFLRNGTYIATFCIPVEEYANAFNYLSRKTLGYGHKLELSIIAPGDACLFTVPYQMFEEEWILDIEDLKSRFVRLASAFQR